VTRRHQGMAALGILLIAASATAQIPPQQAPLLAPTAPAVVPPAVAPPPTRPQDLQLETFMNDVATGWIVHVRQTPSGGLLIAPEDLSALGLQPAPQAHRANAANAGESDGANHWMDDWVDLHRLPGVRAVYDKTDQTLRIHAQDAAMQVRIIDAQRRPEGSRSARTQLAQSQPAQSQSTQAPAIPPTAQDNTPFGAYLNHTLIYNTGGTGNSGWRRFQDASVLADTHVFGGFGVLSSAQLFHHAPGGRMDDTRRRSVRLGTQWTYMDPAHLVTYSAGDFVSSSLPWSRSARLAGVQIRRNFAIRPDLVTMPLLGDLTGSAAVPSTVEVYVNNVRRIAQDVAPGPFAITNLPLITGAGTARLVVRDALGRETVSETPFYASSRLLAQGLADFALETGVARRHFGTRSHDYDHRLLSVGVLRYGLTNAVTLESHAQAGAQFYQAGAGGVFKLGTLGIVTVSAANSHYRNPVTAQLETGQQVSAGLQAQWRGLRLFANTQRTFGDVNDLASVTLPKGTPASVQRAVRPPKRISQVSLALPTMAGVGLSLSYTPVHTSNGVRTRMLGINSSLRLGSHGYFSVSGYKDLSRRDSIGAFATLSFFLGDRLSASISQDYNNHRSNTQLQLTQSSRDAFGSVGWRLRAARGQSQILGMEGSYRSRIGKLQAGLERFDKTVNGRVQFDGAMVLAGGGVFLANRIDNAFGVIHTGAPNIPVQYENRPIGNTNAKGQLLLTDLRAFEDNLITIDPMDLPVDARAGITRLVVKPPWRSGVVVDFNVQLYPRTALIALRDEAGAFIPAGSSAHLNGGAQTFVVGYDGQVYLEGLARDNRLIITQANKPDCTFDFAAPPTLTERLVIADAVCRSAK